MGLHNAVPDIGEMSVSGNTLEFSRVQCVQADIKPLDTCRLDFIQVVFQQNIRIRDGKLRLVKNPKKIEAWITIEVTAIANVLLGKTDMKTAFFSDDIRAVGDNSTSGMIMFINDIYKEVEPQLRDDFGKLGGRLLKILTK